MHCSLLHSRDRVIENILIFIRTQKLNKHHKTLLSYFPELTEHKKSSEVVKLDTKYLKNMFT
jgi:hypothetical protein